jgi:hypothetical protein
MRLHPLRANCGTFSSGMARSLLAFDRVLAVPAEPLGWAERLASVTRQPAHAVRGLLEEGAPASPQSLNLAPLLLKPQASHAAKGLNLQAHARVRNRLWN